VPPTSNEDDGVSWATQQQQQQQQQQQAACELPTTRTCVDRRTIWWVDFLPTWSTEREADDAQALTSCRHNREAASAALQSGRTVRYDFNTLVATGLPSNAWAAIRTILTVDPTKQNFIHQSTVKWWFGRWEIFSSAETDIVLLEKPHRILASRFEHIQKQG
jgi:hypothetical protein